MKIALDIHGVIDENPEFFRRFMHAINLHGVNDEIHVLSGPPMEKIVEELKAFGIFQDTHYTQIFSVVDYHKSIGTNMRQDSDGSWHTVRMENGIWVQDTYVWDRTKADYCLRNGIDMMIDDSEAYAYFFRTPYARFFSKNKRKQHIVQGDVK